MRELVLLFVFFLAHTCVYSFGLWPSDSHGEEEEEDAEDDDEDDEGDEVEEAGEENDRPYNLRQRKTVQRYEAPPIGSCPVLVRSSRVRACSFVHFDRQLFHSPPHRACEQKAKQCLAFWYS